MSLSWLGFAAILLCPYWLGPLVVWLRQKSGMHPAFEPFDPAKHQIADDVAAAFRGTCDGVVAAGFRVVGDLFQAGFVRNVRTRAALLQHPTTGELALVLGAHCRTRMLYCWWD